MVKLHYCQNRDREGHKDVKVELEHGHCRYVQLTCNKSNSKCLKSKIQEPQSYFQVQEKLCFELKDDLPVGFESSTANCI